MKNKILKHIKNVLLLLPLIFTLFLMLLTLFNSFSFKSDSVPSFSQFTDEVIIKPVSFVVSGSDISLRSTLKLPLLNFAGWVQNNLINSNVLTNYILYYLCWIAQIKLLFIIFDAFIFFIDFAERLLNKTYRKD